MDTLNDGDVRRLKFTIEQQQAQLKKLDDQIVSRKRELQTHDEALRLALIASQKRRFTNYNCNNDGIPHHPPRTHRWVELVKAYLPLAEQQSRLEPSPGRPKPPALVACVATADAILAAARKRDEPPAEPTGLAAEIIAAGRKRRGELNEFSRLYRGART